MFKIIITVLSLFTTAPPLGDEDGCWSGRDQNNHECITITEVEGRDGKHIMRFKNRCSERLYLRYCLQYMNGKWSCGADGLRGGKTGVWDAYNSNGTAWIDAIGSLDWGKDWVCASRVGLEQPD